MNKITHIFSNFDEWWYYITHSFYWFRHPIRAWKQVEWNHVQNRRWIKEVKSHR